MGCQVSALSTPNKKESAQAKAQRKALWRRRPLRMLWRRRPWRRRRRRPRRRSTVSPSPPWSSKDWVRLVIEGLKEDDFEQFCLGFEKSDGKALTEKMREDNDTDYYNGFLRGDDYHDGFLRRIGAATGDTLLDLSRKANNARCESFLDYCKQEGADKAVDAKKYVALLESGHTKEQAMMDTETARLERELEEAQQAAAAEKARLDKEAAENKARLEQETAENKARLDKEAKQAELQRKIAAVKAGQDTVAESARLEKEAAEEKARLERDELKKGVEEIRAAKGKAKATREAKDTKGPAGIVTAQDMKLDDPEHLLISCRFTGVTEKRGRELHTELNKINVPTFMVKTTGVGDTFGNQTKYGLGNMGAMLALCDERYGAKTASSYCTFYEVEYATDYQIPVVPIKFCKEWPPQPMDEDGSGRRDGADQNKFFFKPTMIYSDWSTKPWDAKACALEVKEALQKKGWVKTQ